MTKGGLKYLPKDLLEELDKVKIDFNIDQDAEGFRKIAENSRIGRQIRLTIDMNTRRKR